MATGGVETLDSLLALLPATEQSNIKKMSDATLQKNLRGAGTAQEKLDAMDRPAMQMEWIRHRIADSATAAVALQALPLTPTPVDKGISREKDRELEREKLQVERERMQFEREREDKKMQADREKMQWEERRLQLERDDKMRALDKQDALEREKLQVERELEREKLQLERDDKMRAQDKQDAWEREKLQAERELERETSVGER